MSQTTAKAPRSRRSTNRVTMDDVATRARVSASSVSLFLRNPEAVSPRIAPHREEMRKRLSEAVGGGEVNVRATTMDGLGFTGRKEGLTAHAVALLQQV